MCDYCNFKNKRRAEKKVQDVDNMECIGELFKSDAFKKGACYFTIIDTEGFDLWFEINYCPMCGRKLKED